MGVHKGEDVLVGDDGGDRGDADHGACGTT
jgi:hypothetical protein